ncbi:hypothetical protein G5B37_01190 [Rasiella rasia]|uniref:Uncharacterized protein n=1 Tax=Rasiella rasia TaxID=2744027 RepID=A0A6G6GI54_9FLAO|nr:hypothetical protein [Rasiella rasia]QIE58228.1 hypothetical protein G5B37_01190 [Rasiella rasia]
MKHFVAFLLFFPLIALGQNDFESRYFTLAASVETELPTPQLSAFQKKVANSIYKKSRFSDFTNQQVTRQNFWQPVDMAATANERQRYSNVSTERLQAGFGRTQVYGYTTDGKTRARNSVYLDQQYYSPIYNPYGSYYRNRSYSPYGFRPARRSAIFTIGGDN